MMHMRIKQKPTTAIAIKPSSPTGEEFAAGFCLGFDV
jgi:hypothetical protein